MANQLDYLEAARAVAIENLQKNLSPTTTAYERIYALNAVIGNLTDAIGQERRAQGIIWN